MRSKAAIYARISRDREGTEVGVENQEAACRRLADEHGLSVVRVYVDNDRGASTRSRKSRPEFAAMRAAAERGEFGVIIAYSNSRLTRRPREFEDLIELHERYGIRYVTRVSGNDDLSTADGRMVARIKAASDAAEAERTGERVAFAHEAKRRRGESTGGPRPFGFEADQFTIRESEAVLIREGVRMIVEDGATLYAVARAWEASRVRTAPWRSSTVRDILVRPRNTGALIVGDKDYGKGDRPAIITDAQREELLAVLAANPKPRRGAKPRTSTAVRIVTCGTCGAGVELTMDGKGGRVVRCSRRGGGVIHPTMPADALERELAQIALMHVVDPDASAADREEVASLRRTLAEVTVKRDRARADVEAYEDEDDRAYANARVNELSAQVRAARAALDAALASDIAGRARDLASQAWDMLGDDVQGVDPFRVFGSWWPIWESWPTADRRELLKGDEIVLLRARDVPKGASRLRVNGVQAGGAAEASEPF